MVTLLIIFFCNDVGAGGSDGELVGASTGEDVCTGITVKRSVGDVVVIVGAVVDFKNVGTMVG